MELRITSKSRAFLEKNAPEVLKADSLRNALISLYEWIEIHGFTPDNKYNSLGEQAQEAYDDIYDNND